MAHQAAIHQLRPRKNDRGAHEHPVAAKLSAGTHDLLTGLSFVDQTNIAEQIRSALDFYFALRMQDQAAMAKKIAAERDRHEAVLAAVTGGRKTKVTKEVGSDERPTASEKKMDGDFSKPVTLRVDSRTLDMLTAFALIDEKTLADVLRDAVDEYIEHRRKSPQLAQKLDAAKQSYERTMAALIAGPVTTLGTNQRDGN
jgi:hypothetical protein